MLSKVQAIRCHKTQLKLSQKRFLGCATRGNAFAGEAAILIDRFFTLPPLFVKLERRRWFFDEAGWLEVSAVAPPRRITVGRQDLEESSLAIS